jgi:hypothetical protein
VARCWLPVPYVRLDYVGSFPHCQHHIWQLIPDTRFRYIKPYVSSASHFDGVLIIGNKHSYSVHIFTPPKVPHVCRVDWRQAIKLSCFVIESFVFQFCVNFFFYEVFIPIQKIILLWITLVISASGICSAMYIQKSFILLFVLIVIRWVNCEYCFKRKFALKFFYNIPLKFYEKNFSSAFSLPSFLCQNAAQLGLYMKSVACSLVLNKNRLICWWIVYWKF